MFIRGNGALSGAVNPADTAFNLAAYQHTTNRDNVFNQTDFVYKTDTGPVAAYASAFGTEFGRQTGVDIRNTGIFPERDQHHRGQSVRLRPISGRSTSSINITALRRA